MARVQSGSNQFTIAAQKTIAETQKLLVKVAKREHAKVMATAPRPISFSRFVDGRKGATEETVKANGTILYTYPRLDLVAQFAMETLVRLSPVLSGQYRNSHTLFLNGAAVSNLKNFKSGDEVTISNFVPYSRKIEIGKMNMRVPGNVYERAKRIVQARYGNMAAIDFTYRGLIGRASGSGTLVNPRTAKGRAHNRASLRHPVMTISER